MWHPTFPTYGKKLLGYCAAALVVLLLVAAAVYTSISQQTDKYSVTEGSTWTKLKGHARLHPIAISLVLVLVLLLLLTGSNRLGLIKPAPYYCTSKLLMFVLTILTDITPNGFLPLPYLGHGLHPLMSCAVVVVCGAAAAKTMIFLHEVSTLTEAQSYKGLCAAALPGSLLPVKLLPLLTTLIMMLLWANCFGNLIAYLGLAADLLVVEGTRTFLSREVVGFTMNSSSARTLIVCVVSLLIWPICTLEGLDGMTSTVVLGNLSVVFAVVCMIVRCLDGSYSADGVFHVGSEVKESQLAAVASVGSQAHQLLVFASGVTVAFMTHYNVFFYRQSCDGESFKLGVRIAFMLAAAAYCIVLFFAWQTFEQQGVVAQSVVLNTYSMEDLPMRTARVAVATSILCSFPIMFNGFRDASEGLLLGFCGRLKSRCPACVSALTLSRPISTAALMVPVLAAAVTFDDVSTVITVLGLVCGFGLVYFLPSLFSWGVAHARKSSEMPTSTPLPHDPPLEA